MGKRSAVCKAERTIPISMDHGMGQMVSLPANVDCIAATGSQPAHFPVFPFVRQCGKQADDIVMALQKHFYDAGTRSIIPVNLERRMRVEQIRIRTALLPIGSIRCFQLTLQKFQRPISITESGPKTDSR